MDQAEGERVGNKHRNTTQNCQEIPAPTQALSFVCNVNGSISLG